jgi:tetratricopeptide (TPR) repeat protein
MFLSSLSTAIARILGVPTEMIGVGFALFSKSSGILLLVAIGAVLLIRGVTRLPHERWDDKGNALSKSGRYEKAIAAYDNALQTKPNHYKLWYKRGKLLTVLDSDIKL